VNDLIASIRTRIANWMDNPKPFVWRNTAHKIADSLVACCQRIYEAGHSSGGGQALFPSPFPAIRGWLRRGRAGEAGPASARGRVRRTIALVSA
jgi:hypothetical protein